MHEALSVAGEGAYFFGRRPEGSVEQATQRRLVNNLKSPYKFAYARTALKYGLKESGILRGNGVLVPDFICDSIIEPLDELGVEPQYYPVDSTLQPVWDQVEKRITSSTKAFMAVHYFGQPQEIPKCMEFCRKYSIVLIEDNAHGFGGTFDGRLLGTFGCLGFSAPHKSFPISNGAYLYLGHDGSLDLSALLPTPTGESSAAGRLKHRLKGMRPIETLIRHRDRIIEHGRRNGERLPYGSQLAFRDPPIGADYGMDASNDLFLEKQNIESIRDARRRIYSIWLEWAVNKGLVPVFPNLLPGAVPLVFPAFANAAPDSLSWFDFGHRCGIDIHSWPTLPQSIVAEDGGAMRLWERLVCFPIHQGMDPGILARRLARL
jgi:perosamine synthetase